jgi:hypothetical protein
LAAFYCGWIELMQQQQENVINMMRAWGADERERGENASVLFMRGCESAAFEQLSSFCVCQKVLYAIKGAKFHT